MKHRLLRTECSDIPGVYNLYDGETFVGTAKNPYHKLFSEAPDMLEALQTTYGVLWMLRELGESDLDEVIDLAKAAINKATQEEVTQ